MRTLFNIHNWIAVDWEKGLLTPLVDYSRKLHFFLSNEKDCERCPIRIRISASLPPEDLRKTLIPSAERFAMGDGIFEVSQQWGRRKWKFWVAGLDTSHVSIYYSFPFLQRLEKTTAIFPDYLIASNVLEPIIEYKLQELSGIVIHACAYAKNGKAVILAGRGGIGSTLMMNQIRNGAEFLANDLLIVKDGRIWSYPTTDTCFDCFYLHGKGGTLNLRSIPGAFFHIARKHPISFPAADSAIPERIGLFINSHNPEYRIIGNGTADPAFLRRMTANDKLESLDCGDEEECRGRYLLHFNQVLGNDAWGCYWKKYLDILFENFLGLPYTLIQAGKHFSPEIMEHL